MTLLHIVATFLVTEYLVTAVCLFINWQKLFLEETDLSSDERYLSMLTLCLATILWPLIVPISYIGLISRKSRQLGYASRQNSIAKHRLSRSKRVIAVKKYSERLSECSDKTTERMKSGNEALRNSS